MANYSIVDSVETLEAKLAEIRAAQEKFSTYTQEQVDEIFKAAASAANKMRIPLAKMAVEETGMGIVEDKIIKNNYAAEHIYNAYKFEKTCGVIEENKAFGLTKIATQHLLQYLRLLFVLKQETVLLFPLTQGQRNAQSRQLRLF